MIVALVLPLLLVANGTQEVEGTRAPDDRPGFGPEATLAEIRAWVQPEGEEAERRLAELRGLEGHLRLNLDLSAARYEERGYFALLGEDAAAGPADLHAWWATNEPRALEHLRPDSALAPVFARLFADVGLRLRARALDCPALAAERAGRTGWEIEAHELSGGLALLLAHFEGYAELKPEEARQIASRVDLAAARLRSIVADLDALRRRDTEAAEESDDADVDEVLSVTKATGQARERAYRAARTRIARREEREAEALAAPRLCAELGQELLTREERSLRADRTVAAVRELLPDYPEGLDPGPAVAELSNAKRYAFALRTALEGLELDPLDAELAYLAGHATSFLYGDREARKWFDRFLALRRIRGHDHRTYRSRTLTSEEERALAVVQHRFRSGR